MNFDIFQLPFEWNVYLFCKNKKKYNTIVYDKCDEVIKKKTKSEGGKR